MRTVFWESDQVHMIDQRRLPASFEVLVCKTDTEVGDAIKTMAVRGAPAIGAAAAFGLALAACASTARTCEELVHELDGAATRLRSARPTAVNLSWALDRVLRETRGIDGDVEAMRGGALRAAQRIADEDVEINKRMARHGAELIASGDTIIHHCNTGALATVDWGTALGVIRMAHDQGKQVHVLVDETRPRLQGARLTAWELGQYGISYEIISDGMAGHFLQTGAAQKVFFGADRVAANGDVANKVGTYMLALAAHDNGVPAYAVVPTSTIDLALADGTQIPIEEREPGEVLEIRFRGEEVAPAGARARNPAFDITPHRLISAIVTENGIVRPPFKPNLAKSVVA